MPFYEYQCKNCGHELEAMQKVSDTPLKKCPHCGKSQLQRLMSAPVFRLKGGGWYETDFKDDKDKKRNLADRPESDAGKEKVSADAKDKPAEPAKADAVKSEAATEGSKSNDSVDKASKSSSKSPAKKANMARKKSAKLPKKAAKRRR